MPRFKGAGPHVSDLYPLRFTPYLKESIWGSNKLQTLFRKPVPPGKLIGESWELFDENTICNGPLSGLTLAGAVQRLGGKLTGPRADPAARFPLLAKLSTTEMDLSVQVHPDDEQALRLEPGSGFTGKTEALYILDAVPGSRVLYGFKEQTNRQDLEARLERGTAIVDVLQELPVERGDVIYVPPGTIHAYGAGLVYFELQQTSDITYRLFDWNRVDATTGRPRQLHVARGLDVINYRTVNPPPVRPVRLEEEYGIRSFLVACERFLIEELDLSARLAVSTDGRSFHTLFAIEGNAVLRPPAGSAAGATLCPGDTLLVPAALAAYEILPDPTCRILRASVPDLEHDVIEVLTARGIPRQEIVGLGGALHGKNDLAPLLASGSN
jgi:mannose-6-phosphate isomerase